MFPILITPEDFSKIDQAYIENLIKNRIEESYHLDYKRELTTNKEIAKDISSFANSDGGNIIYGIDEEENFPTTIVPINGNQVREKIDSIAKDGIDPPLNIRILPVNVQVNGVQGQVFIVYIPKKYPRIHQAKRYGRYYKRTEFSSSPMSNSEIEMAFKLYHEHDIQVENRVETIEKGFKNELEKNEEYLKGYSSDSGTRRILNTILNICPLEYTNDIFRDNERVMELLQESHYNISKKEKLFEGVPQLRQNDFIFKSSSGYLKNLLVHKDGIIIYNFRNVIEYKEKRDVNQNPTLPFKEIFDFFCGFFNFLHTLFQEFHYYGDVSITLKINDISGWEIEHEPFKAQQTTLSPIKIIIPSEQLKKDKMSILKNLFGPVLNAYGRTNENSQMIYDLFEPYLD